MTKRQMVYAKFESLEEHVAHWYFKLHERFIANPPLAKFWVEAAMDELQHSSMLRFCRERELMSDVDVDPKTTEHLEDLLDTVKGVANDPDLTVDEAFYASLLMESSELEDAYGKLTAPLAKDHPLLFEAIRASLRWHHGCFVDAVEQFSNDRGLVDAFKALEKSVS
jgi:hypothetical protein